MAVGHLLAKLMAHGLQMQALEEFRDLGAQVLSGKEVHVPGDCTFFALL